MSDDDSRKLTEDTVPGEPQDEPSADEGYKVGYGRPPIHGRFKPGQSGNAKGRPKGRRNAKTIGAKVLNRAVTVRENGKARRIPALEAMLEVNVAQALKGNHRAFGQVIAFSARTGLLADEATETPIQALPEDDAAILEDFLRRKGSRDPDGSSGGGNIAWGT
jgi:hypothetical protein